MEQPKILHDSELYLLEFRSLLETHLYLLPTAAPSERCFSSVS